MDLNRFLKNLENCQIVKLKSWKPIGNWLKLQKEMNRISLYGKKEIMWMNRFFLPLGVMEDLDGI